MKMLNTMKIRTSVRKYKEDTVSQKDFDLIKGFIDEVKPLNDIPMDIILFEDGEKIKQTFKGITNMYAKVYAPHYLAFTSEVKDGYLENIGFVGEQIVLKMTDLGIGTCWVGSSIDQNIFKTITQVKGNQNYLILIAFGYPKEELKPIVERKRLNPNDFVEGKVESPYEPILEAVRIAPSAVNSQPWDIVIHDDRWDVYLRGKNILTKKMLYKMNKIDMGIALSHIFIASMELGYKTDFKILSDNIVKSKEYITSVKFSKSSDS